MRLITGDPWKGVGVGLIQTCMSFMPPCDVHSHSELPSVITLGLSPALQHHPDMNQARNILKVSRQIEGN